MDICLNEWSLEGQFASETECLEQAVYPLLDVLRRMERAAHVLYKTYTLYERRVTPSVTLHALLTGCTSRDRDELRRLKTLLARLFDHPYWEDAPRHSGADDYTCCGVPAGGTSLAEACERDRLLLSFLHPAFSALSVEVRKNGTGVELGNFHECGGYMETLRRRGAIAFADYVRFRYGRGKLNFDRLAGKSGFGLLTAREEAEFEDAFRLFDTLSWTEIYVYDALDYKEYTNARKDSIALFRSKKIYKFRTSGKFRCFGEVSGGVFYVLLFDLTHKLSD